jgi:hypothetical protein
LTPTFSSNLEVDIRELLAAAGALSENRGLVELILTCYGLRLNDETWGAIIDSLKAHPTLEILDLRGAFMVDTATPTLPKSQAHKLVDMMKVNMSIHTIHLHDSLSPHDFFRGAVIPYLETNRFRPRPLGIQKTRPIAYRAKLLGRALLAVRTDPNRFWMLVSGNAEIAFPSKTTTIVAAANLPTPATAAATTTATGSFPTAVAAATAATSAATPSTGFLPTMAAAAAATAAIPSTDHKRKARP